MPLHVLSVASEIFPLVKTGGLADVTAALAHALAAEDVLVRTLIPGYPAVLDGARHGVVVHEFDELHGGPARLLAAKADTLDLLVLDAPHLYAREGNPYVGPDGNDWPDNAVRFGALCRVASMVGTGLLPDYRPDVVHAHDWQAGLTPVYLHFAGDARPATVITVHNLAFQGQFPPWLRGDLMLPEEAYTVHGVEYYGSIGFLKGALALADRITTVSPTYAAEIRTPEHGMGLDGVLRERFPVLSGILNGVDTCVWNPANDKALEAPYDTRRLAARAKNKAALQARLGLEQNPDVLLFGVIGRLSWQKGVDILLDSLGVLDAHGAQLAVVGSGDHILEHALVDAASHRHGRMAVSIGYSEALAHLVQGGADALIVPSRFEPCGLTQLCALRYGALPIVSRVGGLADTVIDANAAALEAHAGTGFVFAPPAKDALNMALERVALLWRDREQWKAVQRRGMATDVSWKRPAARYAQLYREAIAERQG